MPGYVRGAEKHRLFREADLFAFPSSHDEGFPTVIVEALGAGLPIIYTPVGGLEQGLGTTNGVRIELSELAGETLERSMWELYRDPSRRRVIAEANRELARARYDVGVVCAQMGEIYQQVGDIE